MHFEIIRTCISLLILLILQKLTKKKYIVGDVLTTQFDENVKQGTILLGDSSPPQTKFLGPLSNYLLRCIWPVNKLPRALRFRKQHCSSLQLVLSTAREKRVVRVTCSPRWLKTRTINFSTVQFENSSPHHRRSITSPKNRATAYAFLFPRQSIYPSDDTSIAYTTRDIFSPSRVADKLEPGRRSTGNAAEPHFRRIQKKRERDRISKRGILREAEIVHYRLINMK